MKMVLLSGGSGARLWPLSNRRRSKQFLKVLKGPNGQPESMVQRVWRQLGEAGIREAARFVAGQDQADLLLSQLGDDAPIITEPERRDTFPAVALAAAHLHSVERIGPGETVVVLPVDPYAETDFFRLLAGLPGVLAETGADLALVGTEPDHPSETFGYIVPAKEADGRTAECETMRQTAASIPPAALAPPEPKAPSGAPVPSEPLAMPAAFRVAAFREKPDRQEASRLIRLGALWNCGVFAFRLRFMLDLLEANGWPLQYEALVRRYAGLAKTSFDRAVVEKAANIVAVRYDGKWKDLGTWPALAAELSDRVIGMGLLAERSDGTHLVNELEIPVAVLGIPDAIVAAGPDGVMVANKAVSHKIKEIAGWFDRRPMLEEHRWGESRIMDRFRDGDGCETIVRRLSLKDGARIGNRVHLRRRGLWVVLAGEGEAVIGGRLKRVSAGDALPIPPGTSHGIRALQGLVLLEIQRGANLDDSDAVHESGDRRDAAAGGLRRSETD